MKICAADRCSTAFQPYRSAHRYCSSVCQQRGKYLRTHPNVRDYPCAVDGCERPAYARHLCNAHYLRQQNGRRLDTPIRKTRRQGCRVAGCAQTHYGHGLCKRHYATWRRYSNTSHLVRALGGRCVDCGGSFPVEVFDFHHRDADDKTYSISHKVADVPIGHLLEEARKCDLLCANCHRIRHSTYEAIGGLTDE